MRWIRDTERVANATAPGLRHRARRAIVGPLLGLLLLALAAAGLWWWLTHPAGDVLEADWTAHVLTVAGTGIPGVVDGAADRARFSDPFGVALASDGTLYASDAGDAQAIRGVSPDGHVFTLAGGEIGFADGRGTEARFDTPSGLAIDAAGVLYVADTGNHAIRRITREGHVSTVAGDGVPGFRDGPGARARFNGPIGLALDPAGRIIVADTYNDRVRVVEPNGAVATLAVPVASSIEGEVAAPGFDTPSGVAVDAVGRIYVADTGSGQLRIIDPAESTGSRAVVTGGGRPVGVAVGPGGEVYVSDDRGRVLEISREGIARTVAGARPGYRDGNGDEARFRRPAGLAVDGPGRLVVADAGNAVLRLVAARSRLGLRPPASPRIAPSFDAGWFGSRPLLWPVAPMEGPHEIAGTSGEARGSDGAERFHTGIDIRAEHGDSVHAVRDAVVTDPVSTGAFGSLNEWLRLGPITYVHVRAGRTRQNEALDSGRFVPSSDETGTLVAVRVRRGARFRTGDIIGTVNAFNHVHVNVGWPGEEYNPLLFGPIHFTDRVPPTIPAAGVKLFDEFGAPLTKRERKRLVVTGRIQIVVNAWDQADGNRPSRRLGLYALGYQVLKADGSPAPGFEVPRDTLLFNRSAADADAARLVYAPGSGIPFYGRRVTRFLYIVTNSFRDGVASTGFWDSTLLEPGDYALRVHATDFHGNRTERTIPVTVAAR